MQNPQETPKEKADVLHDAMPQFEQFIESRESYIKALETTLDVLRRENQRFNKSNAEIRSSIDELVAMQRLSNTIATSLNPDAIVRTLIELTRQVLPVHDSNIFLFTEGNVDFSPLVSGESGRLEKVAREQLEAGIVDWVLSEHKTVIIPDLSRLDAEGASSNFVIVPLILRNRYNGIYIIHTPKHQTEFSNQDIQLLTVLAHQAAVGIENWEAHRQLQNANEELKASRAQMLQAAKLAAVGEMAAGILHEIKNPLQIMMMQVEMVERGKALPNWTEMFSQQVRRLSDMARRLMNFTRNASEDCAMVPVDVNAALLEVVDIVSHDFKSSRISIEQNLAACPVSIEGNANYLQQVFINLMINARDAMPHGGVLKVSTEARDGQVLVRIADTGTGIPPENLQKIFQAFFTTKEEGKGTGLGLSICNKIVEQHRGTIRVESTVGTGTTFTIALPVGRREL